MDLTMTNQDPSEPTVDPPIQVQPAPRPAFVRMRRTTSQDIREGTEDLKEAAEQSVNVILELGLDGRIRWASPSWADVVGTNPDDIHGQPIADVVLDPKTAFAEATEHLREDSSRSRIVRVRVPMGPRSTLARLPAPPRAMPVTAPTASSPDVVTTCSVTDGDDEEAPPSVLLEGQGILVYDRASGEPSHVSSSSRLFPPPSQTRSRD